MLDGASNDEGVGPPDDADHGAGWRGPGSRRADECVLRRVRLDVGPGDEHRHEVGHQRRAWRRSLPCPPGRAAGEDLFDQGLLRAVGAHVHDTEHARRDQSCRSAGRAEPGLRLDRRTDRQKDKTFAFATADYTAQNRTTFLSNTLPAFVLPPDGSLEYVGHYRQTLFNGRLDHKLTPSQTLMVRGNYDHFYDTNPNDAVVGTSAPTVARRYTRGSRSVGVNHTAVGQLEPAERGAVRVSGWRAGHALGGADPVDDLHARRIRAVHDRRVARSRHLRPPGAVRRHGVVGAGQTQPALRRQRDPSHHRRFGQRTRPGDARHVHVPEHDDRPVQVADAGGRPAVTRSRSATASPATN